MIAMCTLEWQRDTFVDWYKVGQKVATWHLGFCPNQMENVPGRFNTRHKDWTRYEDTKSYITVEDIWTSVRLSYLCSGAIWHSIILDMKVNLTLYDRGMVVDEWKKSATIKRTLRIFFWCAGNDMSEYFVSYPTILTRSPYNKSV